MTIKEATCKESRGDDCSTLLRNDGDDDCDRFVGLRVVIEKRLDCYLNCLLLLLHHYHCFHLLKGHATESDDESEYYGHCENER